MTARSPQNRNILVIVLFIFGFLFIPVPLLLIPAVYLMWKSSSWKKRTKVILTVISVIYGILFILAVGMSALGIQTYEVGSNFSRGSPSYNKGAYVYVKPVKNTPVYIGLKPNDVIIYAEGKGFDGYDRVARVKSISTKSAEGGDPAVQQVSGVVVSMDAEPNKTFVISPGQVIGVVKMCYWNCK